MARGSIKANLGDANPPESPDLSDPALGLDMFTITMPEHEVSTDSNSYYCTYAEIPGTENYRSGISDYQEYGDVIYNVGWRPIVTTDKVHHVVLFACQNWVS